MATNSCVWTGSNLIPWTAPNTGSWVHVQQGGLTPAPNKWCDGAGHGLMDCTATVAGTLASMVQAPGVNIAQPVEANITFQRSAVCATAGTQWIECGLIICADSDQNPQNFVAIKTIELSDGGKQPAQKYCVAMYTIQSGIWSQWIITATIADLSGTFRNWIIKARVIGLPDNSAILQMKGYNPAQTTEPGWVSSGGSTATYSFTYATTLGPTYSSAWAGNRYGIFTGWYTTGVEYYTLYSNYNVNNVTVTNLVVQSASHGTTSDASVLTGSVRFLPNGNGTGPRDWAIQDYTTIDELLEAADGLYIQAQTDTNLNTTSFTLTDVPAVFGSMLSLSTSIRMALSINTGDDSYQLLARIVSRTNGKILAAHDSAGAFRAINTLSHSTTFSNYGFLFTYINLTATKADWDDAEIEFRQSWTQVNAPDSGAVRIDAIYCEGAYTIGIPTPTLVVANAAHAQTANVEVLTQVHNLTVANASHAQVANTASPSYNLIVVNSSHIQNVDVIVLQRIHNLVNQDVAQTIFTDNVVLARIHNLEIQSSIHTVPTDGAIVLDQHVGVFDLVVQDVTHDVTSQNVAITQLHILVVSDTQHQTFVGSIVIPQIHILEIVTNSHATKTDEVSFTQLHILVVDAGLEAVLSENTALVQLHILEIQSPSHSEFVQTCALQVQGSITPFESAHVVKSTNVTLVQNYSLDVQSSSHDISNTIPPIGPVLLVQGATQTTAAQRIDVTQTHHISVTDSKLVTATQNLTLTGTAVLDVSDSYQTVESSSSTLSQLHHLVIGSTAHLISSESKNLIQTHILTAANTNHCVTSLNVRFTAGAPKIWLGVSWESKFVKVYRGNDIWNDVFMYRWTGNEWVTV